MSDTHSGTVHLNNYLQSIKDLTAISWEETSTGLEHKPEWTCICKFHGKPYGVGKGPNKPAARDIAAWSTLKALLEDHEREPQGGMSRIREGAFDSH